MQNEKVQIRLDDWSRETFDLMSAFVTDLLSEGAANKRQKLE
jgi:hypothetical protein